jgi:hypothetical protein
VSNLTDVIIFIDVRLAVVFDMRCYAKVMMRLTVKVYAIVGYNCISGFA